MFNSKLILHPKFNFQRIAVNHPIPSNRGKLYVKFLCAVYEYELIRSDGALDM